MIANIHGITTTITIAIAEVVSVVVFSAMIASIVVIFPAVGANVVIVISAMHRIPVRNRLSATITIACDAVEAIRANKAVPYNMIKAINRGF